MEWCLSVVPPWILSVLTPLCGNALSCLCGKVGYMCKLKENIVLLKSALDDLLAAKADILTRVEAGERNGEKQLEIVTKWISKVEAIERRTNDLIDEARGQGTSSQVASAVSTSGCWSMDNISNCSLGERVFKALEEVRNHYSIKFESVTHQGPPPVVEITNVPKTFGLDKMLKRTWENLMKDETRMLGIYGMGGVGKTTLLTLINNKFPDVEDKFDVVIWVKVSEDEDISKIQDDNEKIQVVIKKIQDTIGERFRICDEKWSTYSKYNKAVEIFRVLNTKPRFVLLLDDLWEEVSLSEIGIPLMGREYKIVFTTRNRAVSGSMGGNDIEVERLAETDAWDMFNLIARCGERSAQILDIAKKIADRCCGLPLALQVIGKTMASKETVFQWRRALDALESSPSEMEGMEKKMFRTLKLSYDYLQHPVAEFCFLYCALFPKAYNIKRDELVEYWIGEGYIDEKNQGYNKIDTLVEAGLLLEDESKQKVYMHDMIREMALWIVSKSENGESYVVKAGAGLSQLPDVAHWKTVTKMSLMNNQIGCIPHNPGFPNQVPLITLFLQNNKLVDIVGTFFQLLSTLVVLDLSHNLSITELPREMSKLVALRYLSLLGTMIKYLPEDFGDLKQLIHLDLDSTSDLRSISLISQLVNLRVLRFSSSFAALDESVLTSLGSFPDLQLLTITVKEADVFNAFLRSELAGKTEGLYLEGLDVSGASLAAIGALDSLSKLEMVNCDITESRMEGNTLFKNLSAVVLLQCTHLKDLTWLIHAENLELLNVESSPMMEVLINEEKAEGVDKKPFQNLQVLRLHYLDELSGIDWSRQRFPKLKPDGVDIQNCPKTRFPEFI